VDVKRTLYYRVRLSSSYTKLGFTYAVITMLILLGMASALFVRHESDFYSAFRHNPYCVLDPTCINPLGGSIDGLRNWGFARNDFIDMNHFSGMALPNYGLFMMVLASFVAFTHTRWLPHSRRRILIGLVGWAVLEHLRWFSSMDWSVSNHDQIVLWLQFLGLLAFSLSLIWSVDRIVARVASGFPSTSSTPPTAPRRPRRTRRPRDE
jgi:hypothetical protein